MNIRNIDDLDALYFYDKVQCNTVCDGNYLFEDSRNNEDKEIQGGDNVNNNELDNHNHNNYKTVNKNIKNGNSRNFDNHNNNQNYVIANNTNINIENKRSSSVQSKFIPKLNLDYIFGEE